MNRSTFLKWLSAIPLLPVIGCNPETDYAPVDPVDALDDKFEVEGLSEDSEYHVDIRSIDSNGNVNEWTEKAHKSGGGYAVEMDPDKFLPNETYNVEIKAGRN